jgi:hypothetical protein
MYFSICLIVKTYLLAKGEEVKKMAEKKQVQPTGKKKSNCGCGCIGITAKKAKDSKPVVKNPDK